MGKEQSHRVFHGFEDVGVFCINHRSALCRVIISTEVNNYYLNSGLHSSITRCSNDSYFVACVCRETGSMRYTSVSGGFGLTTLLTCRIIEIGVSGTRAVELCSALGWDLDLLRLSSYVSRTQPVRSGPYYQFLESREPGSHGRLAGLTLFRFSNIPFDRLVFIDIRIPII